METSTFIWTARPVMVTLSALERRTVLQHGPHTWNESKEEFVFKRFILRKKRLSFPESCALGTSGVRGTEEGKGGTQTWCVATYCFKQSRCCTQEAQTGQRRSS